MNMSLKHLLEHVDAGVSEHFVFKIDDQVAQGSRLFALGVTFGFLDDEIGYRPRLVDD